LICMNLLHLEYFYIVAREGGFTRASEFMRIQQPAISRMVKQLETDLGFPLFEKVGRNVQLTRQGLEVFENCKSIFGAVDHLKTSLGQIKGICQGPLVIGAAEPIASHFIPGFMSKYLEEFPKVYPSIISGPATMLLGEILSGKIEMGMFFHLPDLPEKADVFDRKMFRYRLVVKKSLRKKKEIIESFIGSREIDDVSTRRFPTIDRIKKDYPGVKIRISSNNLTSHKELVLQGLGVAILPEFLVKDDLKGGHLADVFPDEKFEFEMKLIKRRTSVLSLNATKFLETCFT
jgi:DNA-binding transcriptional LysR family regulator